MAFKSLTDNEKSLLKTFEGLRDTRDRQELIALEAEREVIWTEEAATVLLNAPKIRRMPLRNRAYIEASFAIPRADALERIADAAEAIERAEATMADLRPTFDGGAADD